MQAAPNLKFAVTAFAQSSRDQLRFESLIAEQHEVWASERARRDMQKLCDTISEIQSSHRRPLAQPLKTWDFDCFGILQKFKHKPHKNKQLQSLTPSNHPIQLGHLHSGRFGKGFYHSPQKNQARLSEWSQQAKFERYPFWSSGPTTSIRGYGLSDIEMTFTPFRNLLHVMSSSGRKIGVKLLDEKPHISVSPEILPLHAICASPPPSYLSVTSIASSPCYFCIPHPQLPSAQHPQQHLHHTNPPCPPVSLIAVNS